MAERAASLRIDRDTVRLTLTGHVQGVGFRPFVYRLAVEHGLTGYVQNRLGEVQVVACGDSAALAEFKRDLIERAPPLSKPKILQVDALPPSEFSSFEIVASSAGENARVFLPPDYFMCDDCRQELADTGNRRYAYPFINCTQCGPRYTLIETLPYDRRNTSMVSFPLCEDCKSEYLDPGDRRFHAEPVACPACGPSLCFERPGDEIVQDSSTALQRTLDELANGRIVAVKGIGGYHLLCDATDPAAVDRLRRRKQRPHKPLAVMFPVRGEDGLAEIRRVAELRKTEADLIVSPVRPIVLVRKNTDRSLADNIAPGLREIGVFLPYSPLHQLLLDAFDRPLVATSGNISGEPVLTDNAEASARLAGVADAFLHHDRPIVRPADDPVYRYVAGHMRPLRLGRGCAPTELELPWPQPQALLAAGGHMKGTIALSWGSRVVVSPHIGEMHSPRSLAIFEQLVDDLQNLYETQAEGIVCDTHSGYTTHRWAREQDCANVDTVWHHEAHASAIAAEYARSGQWLVFAWDGVGLGRDGTLWGGEGLLGNAGAWTRVSSLRRFRLPGGDKAGREPWRSAAALNWECNRTWPDCPDPEGIAETAWRRSLNSPVTSAAGRLFDAAAAMIGELHYASYEAQGPMLIESLCNQRRQPVSLPLQFDEDGILRSDWEPLLEVVEDKRVEADARAETFHSSMAHAVLDQARAVRRRHTIDQVGLTGGVFQNRVLAEQAVELLEGDGFQVFLPRRIPANDAGLSFGQAAEIAARAARA